MLFETKKKNNFSQALSLKADSPKFSDNLKLLKKRIQDALDDEYEDEDDWIFDALSAFNFETEFGINPVSQTNSNENVNTKIQQKNCAIGL